jgi:GNAT superfamily N-acetyltransferase
MTAGIPAASHPTRQWPALPPLDISHRRHQIPGVKLDGLDDREAVRGAIRAHGYGWREAYADVLPASVLDQVTVDPDPAAVDRWLDRLPDADDPGVAYGASVGGTVRGYIFARWGDTKPFVGPAEAGLKEVYVHPDWWGGGLGTELLGAAVDVLPPDVDALALEALADNEVGRSFYESRGFTPDARGEIDIGEDSYETVVYRRPVGEQRG